MYIFCAILVKMLQQNIPNWKTNSTSAIGIYSQMNYNEFSQSLWLVCNSRFLFVALVIFYAHVKRLKKCASVIIKSIIRCIIESLFSGCTYGIFVLHDATSNWKLKIEWINTWFALWLNSGKKLSGHRGKSIVKSEIFFKYVLSFIIHIEFHEFSMLQNICRMIKLS